MQGIKRHEIVLGSLISESVAWGILPRSIDSEYAVWQPPKKYVSRETWSPMRIRTDSSENHIGTGDPFVSKGTVVTFLALSPPITNVALVCSRCTRTKYITARVFDQYLCNGGSSGFDNILPSSSTMALAHCFLNDLGSITNVA